jgi:hypothetical protein
MTISWSLTFSKFKIGIYLITINLAVPLISVVFLLNKSGDITMLKQIINFVLNALAATFTVVFGSIIYHKLNPKSNN